MTRVQHPKRLYYEPLPYDTHPIDLAYGEQGWGPFKGPYTPLDFLDVANHIGLSGLNIGYNLAAFNAADHGPGYHDITLFSDTSLDRVNATLTKLANDESTQANQRYSNTISNGYTAPKSGAQATASALRSRIASALVGGK